MAPGTVICPSCGFKNQAPLAGDRCASCGAQVQAELRSLGGSGGAPKRRTFSVAWFLVAVGITAVLTGAVVVGLPLVLPVLDFEGSAGMLVSIPVWFAAGFLVGLIAPMRTYSEPAVAAFLVAGPTVWFLIQSETVKTMPVWTYLLLAAVGVLFSLIGARAGERVQMGGPSLPKAIG